MNPLLEQEYLNKIKEFEKFVDASVKLKKMKTVGVRETKKEYEEEEEAAVAKNIDATFFDVKVSQMLSKYYGESPKIMSALFESRGIRKLQR